MLKKLKVTICSILLIIMIAFTIGCDRTTLQLIWVVPEPYLPTEGAVEIINKKLEQMDLGCSVAFVGVPYDQEKTYTKQIKEMMSADEQMDIIYSSSPNALDNDNYNSAYYRFVKEGIFEPLGQYFDTEFGQKLTEIFPPKHLNAMKINDEIYGINGALTTLSTDNLLLVNTDYGNISWDTTNIYTIDEIGDVLGNSKTTSNIAPFLFFSQYLSYYYYTNCTEITKCVYITNDGKLVYAFDDNEYINYLMKLKTLQNQGILVNGNGQNNYSDCYTSFEESLGGYELYSSFNDTEVHKPYKLIPMEKDNFTRFSNIGTGVSTSSANKDKAFELLSIAFTDPEINNLLVYGVENVDYLLKDGIPINSIGYESLRIYPFGNRLICYPLFLESLNKKSDYFNAYNNAFVPEYLGFVFDDSKIKEQVVITNQITVNFYNTLLDSDVKAEDVKKLVDEYSKQLNQNGIMEIFNEIQTQYETYLKET